MMVIGDTGAVTRPSENPAAGGPSDCMASPVGMSVGLLPRTGESPSHLQRSG